jgi:aerobic carbon-monoxide dehydrogenase large subunit
MSDSSKYFGKAIKRVEDPRFVTGAGHYTDDFTLPGMLHIAMVRSPYAHAKILSIDSSAALAMPGVVAVYTGQDLVGAGINPIPPGWLLEGLVIPPHHAIVPQEAHHVGDIVACVVADSRAIAEDAAALVDVDYDVLPALSVGSKALEPGAAVVHQELAPDNVAFKWSIGDQAETDAQFAKAERVIRLELKNHRLVPNAIEPRASMASYQKGDGEYTLWTTSQNPHIHRLILAAFVMGIPEQKLRVISPDVGGGFGSKIFQYPEEVIVLFATKTLGRPVKWTARRSESFVSDCHGRDHETVAELAIQNDGTLMGLRVNTLANLGAYLTLFAPAVPTYLYGTLLNGPYKFPAIHVNVTGVFTHTVPVDAYRGAGRPEATFVLERIMSLAAHELGLEPIELRRKNFIQPHEFPYQSKVALVYDSGNYEPAMELALEMLGYHDLRRTQLEGRKNGKYIGIGISTYIEACGLAPSALVGMLGAQAGQWESSLVRVYPTGKVEVFTGSHSHGQGHETAFAQIAADELQTDISNITVVHGDTGKMPFGWGSYGSRSAPVGASALKMALGKIVAKARKIAVHLLKAVEADPEQDLIFEDGNFSVKGVPEKTVSFGTVALQAHLAHDYPSDLEPGLEATYFYDPKNFVYPFGTHLAVVEVDAETGKVQLIRYVCVDDCGNIINPLIAEGQVHGGIAQGMGQALLESALYDDDAQLLSATYMEYTMPRADDLPMFEIGHTVTPSPHNPLGVKGIGEAGTIASTAAVANAVIDALEPFGVAHLDMPFTSEKVWRAIRAGTVQPAAADD